MMLRQMLTALLKDLESYRKIRNYIAIIGISVVIFMAIIGLSNLGRLIFKHIMGLEGRVLEEAIIIFRVFIIFPGVVTFRSLAQGICIKFRATPIITISSFVRTIFVGILVITVEKLILVISPGIMAGLMFLSAVTVEALTVFIGSKLVIGNVEQQLENTVTKKEPVQKTSLTYGSITYFFLPLVVTVFIKNLAMPIINSGLGRTYTPELAIAAYAVAWGLGMIFISPLNMFHQVPINFISKNRSENIKTVRTFATCLGVFLSLLMALISFTNIGYNILTQMIGATENISKLAVDVLKYMSILPVIIAAREYYWGILMKIKATKYISRGKIINLIMLIISIVVMTLLNPTNPAIIGIVGMICCEGAEAIYLYRVYNKYKKATS